MWSNAAGFGLKHLGATDFPAVFGDIGVEGHVLSFERGDFMTLAVKDPTQSGSDDAFAHSRTGALNH
jgi:hypothetical protein